MKESNQLKVRIWKNQRWSDSDNRDKEMKIDQTEA